MSYFNELFADAEVIHAYTREDAIRDGLLVQVDPKTAKEAGFVWPVDMTDAAYRDAVRWGEDEQRANPRACQDEGGRLWDVLTMCRLAAAGAPRGIGHEALPFQVLRVPRDKRTTKASLCHLVVKIGWTADSKPTLTIMQPNED